jgi:shikimate kinase
MWKIILIGYMGVGKTTIGQLLAKKTRIDWIDLDTMIENENKLTIQEIFEQYGEIYFRKLEHRLFKKMVENEKELIISTGGGTPCYADNHMLLNGEKTISIYLKASIDTIFERLINNKNERPLITNQLDEELKEFIAKSIFERSYFYNHATYTLIIDGKTPELIVTEIQKLLN